MCDFGAVFPLWVRALIDFQFCNWLSVTSSAVEAMRLEREKKRVRPDRRAVLGYP
jgi:hypothetical protein